MRNIMKTITIVRIIDEIIKRPPLLVRFEWIYSIMWIGKNIMNYMIHYYAGLFLDNSARQVFPAVPATLRRRFTPPWSPPPPFLVSPLPNIK